MTESTINETLVVIKPDGLYKSLTGFVLTKISETKLKIVAAKITRVTRELAEAHYAHLKDKPFFPELLEYIQGKHYGEEYDRVMALVYQGENAIAKVRELAGSTNPEEASSVSIRGAFGRITTKGVFENVIHCSATPPEAEHEIKLWFRPEEIWEDIYPTREVIKEKVSVKEWA